MNHWTHLAYHIPANLKHEELKEHWNKKTKTKKTTTDKSNNIAAQHTPRKFLIQLDMSGLQMTDGIIAGVYRYIDIGIVYVHSTVYLFKKKLWKH